MMVHGNSYFLYIYTWILGGGGGGVHTGSTRVIVRMEKLEWMVLAGETEFFGENLLRRHFVHHKSHLPDPGPNSDRHGGKAATNRFSYDAAL
jgi:hypothetical protein